MGTPYPDYENTLRESQGIAYAYPELAKYEEIGLSEEGRRIPLLTLTDPAEPPSKKSVLLMTGGSDGDEETGRAVCMAFARTLMEPQHRIHLKRQVFLIAPNVNPDGCVRDQAQNAKGVYARHVYPLDGDPVTAEGRVMRALVDEWIPDAHIDFHGFAGGSMGDGEFVYPTVNDKWSLRVLMEVAAEIDATIEAAGFPQQGYTRVVGKEGKSLPKWLAFHHSAFCMIPETTENYYPIEDSIRSGLARMMKLVEIAEETRFFQYTPNYPCDVVSGNRMGAIMPYGEDYTTRRKCRRDISQMIIQGVPWFGREACDYDWTALIRLPVEEQVTTLPEGMVFQATIDRRATIKEVLWHDHVLEPKLWRQWRDRGGIVVRAEVPEPPRKGENHLKIKYEVPFKRHTEPKGGQA